LYFSKIKTAIPVVIGIVRMRPMLPTRVLNISVANISWFTIIEKDASDMEKRRRRGKAAPV